MDTSPATLPSTMTAPPGLVPGVMIGRSQALSPSWSRRKPLSHSTREAVICNLALPLPVGLAVRLPAPCRPGGYTAGAFEYPLKPHLAQHHHWRMLSLPVADAHQVALALAAADTDLKLESGTVVMVMVPVPA